MRGRDPTFYFAIYETFAQIRLVVYFRPIEGQCDEFALLCFSDFTTPFRLDAHITMSFPTSPLKMLLREISNALCLRGIVLFLENRRVSNYLRGV